MNKYKVLAAIWFVLTICTCSAQTNKFPIFSDQRIVRPEGLKTIQPEEIKIDIKSLNQYPEGIIYGDRQVLGKLANYLFHDTEGRELWKKQSEYAAKVLNQWDFVGHGFSANRYTYNLGQLEDLSLVYLFSQHKELGMFIKAHVMQVARLPFEFWLHSELRGYNPKFPLGQLETANVSTGMSCALSVIEKLLSTDELIEVKASLLSKGLQPCLNWLTNPQKHNYSAVISSGALVAATYLKIPEAREQARKVLSWYLNETIESDGSYGEGVGYFNYPVSSLFSGLLCLDSIELKQVAGASGLRYSAEWLVYQYFYKTDETGKLLPHMVHFGDNSYSNSPASSVIQILISLYENSTAAWLKQKFNLKMGMKEMLMAYSSGTEALKPESPKDANLPFAKHFENGDCFVRSSWNDNGIVMALHSGNGSKINFWHQRAEMNSICMGAYGEYLIVSAGSFSYRHPLHYLYDFSTRAANTITVDDKNQYFPAKELNIYRNHLEDASFWIDGRPKSEVIFSKEGQMADLLVNEAAESYFPKMKHARRSLLFVKEPGYFVMFDEMEAASDTTLKYSFRLHFNNRDEQGKFEKITDNHWTLNRPLANLDVYVFSDQSIKSKIGKGYMHGPERDYSPDGENQGWEGSAVELEIFNSEKSQKQIFYTVLFPTKVGMSLPTVVHQKDGFQVGDDKISFDGTECVFSRVGKTERFTVSK